LSVKNIALLWGSLHLFLILTVSCRDICHAFSEGGILLPPDLDSTWKKAERASTSTLGQGLSKSNLLRQAMGAYIGGTGIDAGYNFFAPHVPPAFKLVFELHYGDGHVEYETSKLGTRAGELRMASLLDLLGQTEDRELREGMIKFLVHAAWRDHPNLSSVRAVFGIVNFPTAVNYAHGQAESYRVLCAFDVTAEPAKVSPPTP